MLRQRLHRRLLVVRGDNIGRDLLAGRERPDPDTCTGTSSCDGTHSCKLVNGQSCSGNAQCVNNNCNSGVCAFTDGHACASDTDCVSGHCNAYYVDGDGDGYGDIAAAAAHFCGTAAPAGYSADHTDCCDKDPVAFPGQTGGTLRGYPSANACGSFDYNCSGNVEYAYTMGICNQDCSNCAQGGLCSGVPCCICYLFPSNTCGAVAAWLDGTSGSCSTNIPGLGPCPNCATQRCK